MVVEKLAAQFAPGGFALFIIAGPVLTANRRALPALLGPVRTVASFLFTMSKNPVLLEECRSKTVPFPEPVGSERLVGFWLAGSEGPDGFRLSAQLQTTERLLPTPTVLPLPQRKCCGVAIARAAKGLLPSRPFPAPCRCLPCSDRSSA